MKAETGLKLYYREKIQVELKNSPKTLIISIAIDIMTKISQIINTNKEGICY